MTQLPNFVNIGRTHVSAAIVQVKNIRQSNPSLFWIMVFTVLTRIAIYFGGQPWNEDVISGTILIGDAQVYHDMAVGLLNGIPNLSDDRTLGYPYFVTAIYAISNNSIWLVFAVQTFINVLMVPMVYWAARTVFDSRNSGNFAAATFALSAISIAWASRYLFTETLFTFFLLIFLMIFIKIWHRDSLRWYLLLGIMLGLATIVRSVLQYFIFVPVLVILLQNRPLSRKLIISGVTIIGLVMIISPFQLSNLREYGHYSLSTSSGNVLFGSTVKAKARHDGTGFYQAMADMKTATRDDISNPFDRSKSNKTTGLKSAREHPVDFAILYVQGLISFMIGTEKSSYLYVIFNQDPPVLDSSHNFETFSERIIRNLKDVQKEYFLTPPLIIKLLIEYVAIALGFLILIRRKQKTMAILFLLTIVYFILSTGFMGRAPRYKIPVIPVYAILAGGGFSLIRSYLLSKKSLVS